MFHYFYFWHKCRQPTITDVTGIFCSFTMSKFIEFFFIVYYFNLVFKWNIFQHLNKFNKKRSHSLIPFNRDWRIVKITQSKIVFIIQKQNLDLPIRYKKSYSESIFKYRRKNYSLVKEKKLTYCKVTKKNKWNRGKM